MSDLEGGLGIIQDSHGDLEVQIANLHGDVTATATIGETGIDSYGEYYEYGADRDPASNIGQAYRWHGTDQRSSDALGGIVNMGVRLYNPATGRFLSRDPVEGGNDNSYTYPVDPINESDISGECPVCIPIALAAARAAAKAAAKKYAKKKAAEKARKKALKEAAKRAARKKAAAIRKAHLRAEKRRDKAMARRRCGSNSFVAGTMITLADGSSVPIEDIEIGDLVLATDPATGRTRPQPVTVLIIGEGHKALVALAIDANADGEGAPVVATSGHPFYVVGRGWVDAGELKVGDRTRGSDGSLGTLDSRVAFVDTTRVFNLTVQGFNSYYVAVDAGSVLVHNAKCSKNSGCKKKNDLPSNLRGSKKRPGESTKDALERILGKNPRGGKGPKSDWNRLKKYFDQ